MFKWLSSFIYGNKETKDEELDISFYEAIEYFQTLTIEEFKEQFEMHCAPCKGLLKNYGIVRCESKKFCSLIMNNKLTPYFKVDQLFEIVCFNSSGYERCLLYFTPKYQSNWTEKKIKFMDIISIHFSIIIIKRKNITLDEVIVDLNFKFNNAMDQRSLIPNDHREQEPLYIMYNPTSAINFYQNNDNLSKMIHMINLYKSKVENHIWESYTLIKVVPKLHQNDVDVDVAGGNEFSSNDYLQHDEVDFNYKPINEIFFFINTTADKLRDTHYKEIINPINSAGSTHRIYYELRNPKEVLIQVLKEDFHDWFFYIQELLINKHLNIAENVYRRPSYFRNFSFRIHPDSNISEFVQVGYRLDLSNDCEPLGFLPTYDEISDSVVL
ncbi:hypothetical protein BN7_2249 [Wickerhamomyces ciferrii]|uniref:Uncharacterized protein n=1 Tax=Wickerhamomyces ciferrii (strain ATCC 14091 / BCRC 22168 / CBS 111 / JCM 3599 / NBRC 0793 / NRRL Y-1031 F-60-10) TaxID=1206466 RepID=K0KC99_WICCF|nr:uncharacterized protein BN7_2249 [Wickerhamomyces ciferrii]CCH42705.1 hypothetical protein BN7_2249 [Wickerhamomyces ciferrii]